jgi:hypothetical protein
MKQVALLAIVCAVLAPLVAAEPVGAQPVYVKTTELVIPPDVCSPTAGLCHGGWRSIAYDGTYYYVSYVVATGDGSRGGVHVYRTDGTFVKVLEEGGPHGTYFAYGVAVAGPHVWTSDYWGGNIYKYDTGTGHLIESFRVGRWLVSLSHDGRYLWTQSYGEQTFYRVDPTTHATTGSFSISWPDACRAFQSAPDGRGGLWISSETAGSTPGSACAVARTYRYALTETSPGTLEATLVERLEGFGAYIGLTTNTANRAEFVLDKAALVRSGKLVIPVDHYLVGGFLTLSKTVLSGCLKTNGKVTLPAPAPAGGLTVALSSDNPNVSVPASLSLKAGATTKSFSVLTSAVPSNETATIEASALDWTQTATLTLKPMGPKSVTLTPNPVVGGTTVAGLVTLECPAGPGDIEVALTSTKAFIAEPTTDTIIIPVGLQTFPFEVRTTPVFAPVDVTVKATANGVTKSRKLTMAPVP